MHQLHVTASAYKKTHFGMKIQTDLNIGSVIGHVFGVNWLYYIRKIFIKYSLKRLYKDSDILAAYPESPVGIYFISVKGQISLFSPV